VATPWQYAQIEARRSEVFGRVRRVFRWTVAGSLAAVATIVGVVAHEIPGRAAGATPPPTSVLTPTTSPGGSGAPAASNGGGSAGAGPANTGNTGNTGTGPLPPPVPAPAPTQQAPVAVSGGTGW
jgi:hypothetical protein